MPTFSKSSQEKLDTCHRDLRVLFNYVIKGYDCTVVCGTRSEEAQTKAFNDGFSKVKYPHSKHNSLPSMAADVVPYPIDWRDLNRMRVFAGYVLGIADMLKRTGAIEHNIRWGGDWNRDTMLSDNRFNDFPHFEIT